MSWSWQLLLSDLSGALKGALFQGFLDGRGDLGDVVGRVGQRYERGLELAGRRVDTPAQYPVEEVPEPGGVALLRLVEIRHDAVDEEQGHHRADPLDSGRHAGLLDGVLDAGFEGRPEGLQPLVGAG